MALSLSLSHVVIFWYFFHGILLTNFAYAYNPGIFRRVRQIPLVRLEGVMVELDKTASIFNVFKKGSYNMKAIRKRKKQRSTTGSAARAGSRRFRFSLHPIGSVEVLVSGFHPLRPPRSQGL